MSDSQARAAGQRMAARISERQAVSEPDATIRPGTVVQNRVSHRKALVLYLSNTDDTMVVQFEGFAYQSQVPASDVVYHVLGPMPFTFN